MKQDKITLYGSMAQGLLAASDAPAGGVEWLGLLYRSKE